MVPLIDLENLDLNVFYLAKQHTKLSQASCKETKKVKLHHLACGLKAKPMLFLRERQLFRGAGGAGGTALPLGTACR